MKKSQRDPIAKRLDLDLGLGALFLCLSFLYFAPGTSFMLQNAKSVMGDGTDSLVLPFLYDAIENSVHQNPSHFFYGTVPTKQLNAPYGEPMWIPWIEKLVVVSFAPLVSKEHLPTFFVLLLSILNYTSLYILGRMMGWPRWLAFAGGLGFAISAYVRARAKVHFGFVGLYFLPLIFIGFELVKQSLSSSKGLKSLLPAALVFFFSATVAHYYLVMTVFLSPFLLVYLFLTQAVRAQWRQACLHLSLCVLPAVVLLGCSFVFQAPKGYFPEQAKILPTTDALEAGSDYHPFLERFAARPLDYFAGDTGLGPTDWNPLRGLLTLSILNNLEQSNSHERANSVRWVFWLLLIFGLYRLIHLDSGATEFERAHGPELYFFAGFAAIGFWMSLGPSYGLSLLVHKVFSHVRVSSRAGVYVHFAVLMFACHYVFVWSRHGVPIRSGSKKERHPDNTTSARPERWVPRNSRTVKMLPLFFPFLVLLDYPPFLNSVPTVALQRSLPEMLGRRELTQCGVGMYFPYVSGQNGLLEYYQHLQRMRNTDCSYLAGRAGEAPTSEIAKRLALHPITLQRAQTNDPQLLAFLKQFASCTQINWLYFDSRLPQNFKELACVSLGWTLHEQSLCLGNNGYRPARDPMLCF